MELAAKENAGWVAVLAWLHSLAGVRVTRVISAGRAGCILPSAGRTERSIQRSFLFGSFHKEGLQGATAQACCLSPPVHLHWSFCFLLLFIQLRCQRLANAATDCLQKEKKRGRLEGRHDHAPLMFLPFRVKECCSLTRQSGGRSSSKQPQGVTVSVLWVAAGIHPIHPILLNLINTITFCDSSFTVGCSDVMSRNLSYSSVHEAHEGELCWKMLSDVLRLALSTRRQEAGERNSCKGDDWLLTNVAQAPGGGERPLNAFIFPPQYAFHSMHVWIAIRWGPACLCARAKFRFESGDNSTACSHPLNTDVAKFRSGSCHFKRREKNDFKMIFKDFSSMWIFFFFSSLERGSSNQ